MCQLLELSEVGIVSQAVGTFITWPKHLVRITPHIELVCMCSNIFTYVLYIYIILTNIMLVFVCNKMNQSCMCKKIMRIQ